MTSEYDELRYAYMAEILGRIKKDGSPSDMERLHKMFEGLCYGVAWSLAEKYSVPNLFSRGSSKHIRSPFRRPSFLYILSHSPPVTTWSTPSDQDSLFLVTKYFFICFYVVICYIFPGSTCLYSLHISFHLFSIL